MSVGSLQTFNTLSTVNNSVHIVHSIFYLFCRCVSVHFFGGILLNGRQLDCDAWSRWSSTRCEKETDRQRKGKREGKKITWAKRCIKPASLEKRNSIAAERFVVLLRLLLNPIPSLGTRQNCISIYKSPNNAKRFRSSNAECVSHKKIEVL